MTAAERMEGICEAQNYSWANEQILLRKLSRRWPFPWRGRWCCYSSPVWCRAAGGSVHIICLNTAFFFLCRYELVKGRRVKGSTRAEAPVMLPVTFCGLSSWIRDTNERICLYVSMSVVQSRSGDVALKPFKKSSITSVCFGCLVCLAGCC